MAQNIKVMFARQWIVKREIFPQVGLDVAIEANALAILPGLFALNHGREPLEPPFNLIDYSFRHRAYLSGTPSNESIQIT